MRCDPRGVLLCRPGHGPSHWETQCRPMSVSTTSRPGARPCPSDPTLWSGFDRPGCTRGLPVRHPAREASIRVGCEASPSRHTTRQHPACGRWAAERAGLLTGYVPGGPGRVELLGSPLELRLITPHGRDKTAFCGKNTEFQTKKKGEHQIGTPASLLLKAFYNNLTCIDLAAVTVPQHTWHQPESNSFSESSKPAFLPGFRPVPCGRTVTRRPPLPWHLLSQNGPA